MKFERFTNDNSALLLIDHQTGTMGWVTSTTFDEMKRNALILAKAAAILNLPVILTSSMEEHAQGPLLPELKRFCHLHLKTVSSAWGSLMQWTMKISPTP